MPTVTKSYSAPANTKVSPLEGYDFPPYTLFANAVTYYSYVTKPTGYPRPKPVDLFASATPWVVESGQFRYHSTSYTYRRDGGSWSFSGPSSYFQTCPGAPYPMEEDPYVLANLDLKLRGKISSQKVDLLAALAEAHKTADLLTEVSRDIVSSFRALRRGQPAAAVRRLLSDPRTRSDRALASQWLRYQYGLLPTISDIYGAAEALATRVHEGIYHYYRTSVTETKTFSYSGLARGQGVYTRKHTARARVKFDSSELMELESLGITNPLASAYQLIPWSFVIDWVSNFGDILNGLDAMLGVSEVLVQRGVGCDVSHSYVLETVGGGCTGSQQVRKRLPTGSDLSFGALALKGPLDTNSPVTRFANAAALVRQLLR